MNAIITLANHDTKSFLDVLAMLTIVENEIDKLEYTGNFNSLTSKNCMASIQMIRQNVLKKLIDNV